MKQTLFILLALLLFFPAGVRAQVGVELLENGSFEKFRLGGHIEKPLHWNTNITLSAEKSTDAHTGMYALKLYLNPGASSVTYFKGGESICIAVEAGAEYELAYWYKGTAKQRNIVPSITWYKNGEVVRPDKRESERVTITDTWQEHKVTFQAPTADLCSLQLIFDGEGEGGAVKNIWLDDVSFKMTKAPETLVPLDPPAGFKGRTQQREIDLSWHSVGQEGITYHIALNGTPLTTTTQTSYTVTALSPDTEYTFTIQSEETAAGGRKSALSSPLRLKTQGLTLPENDAGRIPYLYRLKEYGECERTLLLHWMDLARTDAQIRYWVDGVPTTPTGDLLTFPKAGLRHLRVEIVETPERRWEITYRLQVKE